MKKRLILFAAIIACPFLYLTSCEKHDGINYLKSKDTLISDRDYRRYCMENKVPYAIVNADIGFIEFVAVRTSFRRQGITACLL